MIYYVSTYIKAKKKGNRSEKGVIEASRSDGCVSSEARSGAEIEWKIGVGYEKGPDFSSVVLYVSGLSLDGSVSGRACRNAARTRTQFPSLI